MSTGGWTVGATNQALYIRKTWQGTDGKYDSDGNLSENPYTMTYRKVYWPYTKTKVACNYGTLKRYVNCSNYPLATTLWRANDELELLNRLTQKIRQHDFNLGVFAAEAVKTGDMVLTTVKRFGCFMTHIRKLQLSQALQCLGIRPSRRQWKYLKRKLDEGDISSIWLELQYGWLPLLSDVYEAGQALDAYNLTTSTSSVRVSGRRKWEGDSSLSPTNYSCVAKVEYSKRIKAMLWGTFSPDQSVGLHDPATIAWELVPFSFVVDWFIPIGSYLEAVSLIPLLEGRYVVSVRRLTTANGYQGHNDAFRCKDMRHDIHAVDLDRSVVSNFTVPFPEFVPPDVAVRGKRILSAIALIHQRRLQGNDEPPPKKPQIRRKSAGHSKWNDPFFF